MGAKEMLRRQALLSSWAFPGTEITVVDTEDGPFSIESAYEEMLSVPGALRGIQRAEADGYDAVIIGCFGDPGLEAAREIVSIPVIGPGEASLLLAAGLGHRFSVVTILDNVVASQEFQAYKAGVKDKLASVVPTNIPVLELMADPATSQRRVVELGQHAITNHRADTLVLGCMTMSFLDVADEVARTLRVPVINAAKAALKAAEAQVAMGLSHSKKAFPFPPKQEPVPPIGSE